MTPRPLQPQIFPARYARARYARRENSLCELLDNHCSSATRCNTKAKRRGTYTTLARPRLARLQGSLYRFWGISPATRTTEAGPSCRGRSQPSSRSVTPRARPPRPILSKRMRRKVVVAQRDGLAASSSRLHLRLRWGTNLDELVTRETVGGKARGVHLIETNDHLIPVLALDCRCHRAALLVPVRPLALGEQLRSAACARVR